MWVGNSTNLLMTIPVEAVSVDHHFVVAHSGWTKGTVERDRKEIIRTMKAMMSETGRKASAWA